MSLTQYLLEFSACLALFYALYYFLLRRETFFQLNRLYLLVTPALAMIIPFLDWELAASSASGNWDQLLYPLVTDIHEQQITIYESLGTQASATWQFTYLDLLLIVYGVGMLWMVGRLLYRTWRLMRLIGRSSQESKEGYTVITPDEHIPAASFLSYVFWQDGPLSPERRHILEHELVHVRQWHSLDVLLMEVWVAVKWFHPMIYWYRNSLRLTHEYIADAYVSAHYGSRLEYARLLTTTPAASAGNTLLHHFNSSIKMRLIMLAKQPSRNWRYFKLLMILPVTAALMLLFSFNLAEELPDELVDPLAKAEQSFNGFVNQPLRLPKTVAAPKVFIEKEYKLKWGDIECNCRSEQFPNLYHCENQSLLPKELRRLVRKEGGFELVLDGAQQPIRELRATSKNAVDMGDHISQLDEMPQGFKTDSPFWKKANKGDVFHFNFTNGNGDYFEFDVVVNNRREEFVFGHLVEMGDFKFNLDLMNNHRVVHMDLEELKKFTETPFRIKKNNSEYYQLKELKLMNAGARRQDSWKRINGDGVVIGNSKAITEAYPGDRLSFDVLSEEGETINFNILIRKNSAWDGRKRDYGMLWGEEEVPMLVGREELQELLKKPLYLKINEQKFRIDNYEIKVFSRSKLQEMKKKVAEGGSYRPISREILSPGKYAAEVRPGDQVQLLTPEEVGGYLADRPMFTVDLEWSTAFSDQPHLKVTEEDDRIVIENMQAGDFEKLMDLEGFSYFQYLYEIDGETHSGYSYSSDKLKERIEQDMNGTLVLNRVSRYRNIMVIK